MALLRRRQDPVTGDEKPTVAALGIDLAAQHWHRSGEGDGMIEVAFPAAPSAAPDAAPGAESEAAPSTAPAWKRGDWVLMRVAADQAERVLVFDRHEWQCFLDGAKNGEFDTGGSQQLLPRTLFCDSQIVYA